MQKELLPVWQQKDQIIKAVLENKVIIVEAPTGSGKTTQLPQILSNIAESLPRTGRADKLFRIGVTQPRRIAAVSVAKRIAYEMNTEFGEDVGYKIRFHDFTSKKTSVKIMTDGILLQEMRYDPFLDEYDIMIVDEAHERSLNIDFILGLLKGIIKQRPDFRVIISSATINAEIFSAYFDHCPILSIKADTFPVDIINYPVSGMEEDAYVNRAMKVVDDILKSSSDGDILIFMAGEASIKQCIRMMQQIKNQNLQLFPLYGQISAEDQEKVFDEYPGKRKIIVATNIAETSITIDGIVYVIDSGLCKINSYNPNTFTSCLVLSKISKASCKQRAGRAGRTRKGYCYRLFSDEDYKHREEFIPEEILRTDLGEVILRMADLGINEYERFNFITPPDTASISSSIKTLQLLGALDERRLITPLGKQMSEFPLSPRIARVLMEAMAHYPDVVYEVLIISSFLSTKNPYLFPMGEEKEARKMQGKLSHEYGDFTSWVKLFNRYKNEANQEEFCRTYYLDKKAMDEILNIHYQLQEIVCESGGKAGQGGSYKDMMLAVLKGFFQNICINKRGSKAFRSLTEQDIFMHPGSVLNNNKVQYMVSGEIVRTGRTFSRSGAMIEKEWIKMTSVDIYCSLFSGRQGGHHRRRFKPKSKY